MPHERRGGRLKKRSEAGGGLVRLEIDPPEGFAATYERPGQYVSAGLGSKETYFALSGEPRESVWEVLVRGGGDVVDALLGLSVGDELLVSAALGGGFPMAEAKGRLLFVLATGSGFAAVRPVLRARVRDGLAGSTELFLGVRVRDDIPLPDELTALRRHGIRVTVCCSRESLTEPGFEQGYVQDALRRRAEEKPTQTAGAIVFAAGVGAMVEHLRLTARDLHFDEADIRTNY